MSILRDVSDRVQKYYRKHDDDRADKDLIVILHYIEGALVNDNVENCICDPVADDTRP